jgi:transposase
LDVGYTTLRRYAHQELGWRERKASVRVDDPPFGDEAQIDFALMGQVPDGYGGTEKLYVLIVVLSASRHMFVWPCLSQTARDVIEGLEAAWRFFGGIPKRIVPDNATSMIVKASATDPVKHRAFAEYTDKRAIFVDPARVRSPQDKARVEN